MKQRQTRLHACNATAGNEASLTSISKAFLLAVPANFSPSTIELPAVMLIQAWLSNTHIFRVKHTHIQRHTVKQTHTHTHRVPPPPHTHIKKTVSHRHSHPYTQSPTHSHPYTPTQALSSDHYLHLPVIILFRLCPRLCPVYLSLTSGRIHSNTQKVTLNFCLFVLTLFFIPCPETTILVDWV